MPKIALALQGGGSHGAFTWGALDRLLEAVEAGQFEVAAISGTSAGAINAVVAACALAEGGPALARTRLAELWRAIADQGALSGNAFAFAAPGPFGLDIDWNPAAIALEALGLVVSPYTNPFYQDPLAPILRRVLPPERLAHLEAGPRLFLTAVNVATCERVSFTQPEISVDTIRASCCLPAEFRAVQLGADFFWDGGYLGNPALSPLIDQADDIVLVFANPLQRQAGMPPTGPRAILDRLNEITFNASVVLEMNAIEAVNSLLADLRAQGIDYTGKYRPIRLRSISDDVYLAGLGVVSKNSTSWPLLQSLHDAGYRAAEAFLATPGDAERSLIKSLLQPAVGAPFTPSPAPAPTPAPPAAPDRRDTAPPPPARSAATPAPRPPSAPRSPAAGSG